MQNQMESTGLRKVEAMPKPEAILIISLLPVVRLPHTIFRWWLLKKRKLVKKLKFKFLSPKFKKWREFKKKSKTNFTMLSRPKLLIGTIRESLLLMWLLLSHKLKRMWWLQLAVWTHKLLEYWIYKSGLTVEQIQWISNFLLNIKMSLLKMVLLPGKMNKLILVRAVLIPLMGLSSRYQWAGLVLNYL
jgi:hypothetical protein